MYHSRYTCKQYNPVRRTWVRARQFWSHHSLLSRELRQHRDMLHRQLQKQELREMRTSGMSKQTREFSSLFFSLFFSFEKI
jgi:RNA:NAD 2'-phosphotransferase (TPT1/KptA family)